MKFMLCTAEVLLPDKIGASVRYRTSRRFPFFPGIAFEPTLQIEQMSI